MILLENPPFIHRDLWSGEGRSKSLEIFPFMLDLSKHSSVSEESVTTPDSLNNEKQGWLSITVMK